MHFRVCLAIHFSAEPQSNHKREMLSRVTRPDIALNPQALGSMPETNLHMCTFFPFSSFRFTDIRPFLENQASVSLLLFFFLTNAHPWNTRTSVSSNP